MTGLRTAAQAVLDEAENPFGQLPDFMTALEALRQALAEPVEPVVVQVNGHVFHRDGKQFIQFEQKSPSLDVPRFHLNENDLPPFLDKLVRTVEPIASCQVILDSSQPSVDALISMIDDLSPIHVNDEYGCNYSEPLIMYHACDIQAILDKYRGQK